MGHTTRDRVPGPTARGVQIWLCFIRGEPGPLREGVQPSRGWACSHLPAREATRITWHHPPCDLEAEDGRSQPTPSRPPRSWRSARWPAGASWGELAVACPRGQRRGLRGGSQRFVRARRVSEVAGGGRAAWRACPMCPRSGRISAFGLCSARKCPVRSVRSTKPIWPVQLVSTQYRLQRQ